MGTMAHLFRKTENLNNYHSNSIQTMVHPSFIGICGRELFIADIQVSALTAVFFLPIDNFLSND